MKKYHLFLMFAAMLLPVMASAQEEQQSFETYIAALNDECPIVYNDDWSVLSFDASGDTAFARIEVPATLTFFMKSLTGNSDNVKQLWKRQLKQFGSSWNAFIRRVKADKRTLVIEVIPKDSKTSAFITFSPDDLKNK